MKRGLIIVIIMLQVICGRVLYGQCVGTCAGSNTSYGEDTGTLGSSITFFGKQAGASNIAQGVFNTFMGYQTGFSNSSGTDNSFYGTQTGFHNVSGSRNSFYGRLAGQFSTADDNSFFGYTAGDSTTSGFSNSYFGSKSGRSNRLGSLNSFFGNESGTKTQSSENAFFGALSGFNNIDGNLNAFFGSASGSANITGKGNTFIGQGSGLRNQHGSYNIYIGHKTGTAFSSQEVDSTLLIDIRPTLTPLIYGQFNERIVRINGTFEATGGVAQDSDINRKKDFVPIENADILEKLSAIEILEWSYKEDTDIRHLGPMAQDFRKAFGLGKNETTITTLDADGVAFASIQALYELLQEEQERNDLLEKKVDELSMAIQKIND